MIQVFYELSQSVLRHELEANAHNAQCALMLHNQLVNMGLIKTINYEGKGYDKKINSLQKTMI
jgi:hypothetical protein